jgi:tol-pal system protein YbgF
VSRVSSASLLALVLAASSPAWAQQPAAPKPAPAPSENRVLLDLSGQIDALGRQVRELRGAIEETGNRVEVFKDRQDKSERRQSDLYNDLDGRARRVEQLAKEDAEARKKLAAQLAEVEGRLKKLEAAAQAASPASAQQIVELDARLKKLESAGGSTNAVVDLDARLKKLEAAGGAAASLSQLGEFDLRLRKLESAAIPSPVIAAVPPPGAASAPAAGATVPPVRESEAARMAYEAALAKHRAGDSQGAVNDFDAFLGTYKLHELTPNAQYWLGEAYFRLKKYPNAIAALQKLLVSYPETNKVPDAMVVLANAQSESGDTVGARRTLEELIAKHPLTDAAEKARQRLARLK